MEKSQLQLRNYFLKECSFFLCFIFFLANPFKAQEISFSAIPDWVKPQSAPKTSTVGKYEVSSGAYPTLYDFQYNLNTAASFYHMGIKVLTHGGTSSASEISITYDSSYQKLIFHHLYIWRDNQRIDKTKELSFEFITNEENLQSRIYNGKLTAYDILEDIRLGDMVEYAYTIVGNNPIFGDSHFDFINLQTNNPIDALQIRLLYGLDQKIKYTCTGCDSLQVNKTIFNDNFELTVKGKNIKAVKYEETAPSYLSQYNYLSFSTYPSWKEVEKWGVEVFDLQEDQNLKSILEEICEDQKDTAEMITAIIDFVQNEIRYMGVESGIGSHQPFPPEQVAKQRFGDCKDKSLLAVSLLKLLGIQKSYPVLVSSSLHHGIDRYLPAAQLFDHCILYFEYQNKKHWIDPTISSQGESYENRICPDYGKVLILGAKKHELTDMELQDKVSRTEMVEIVDVSSFSEAGSLTVSTDMYGLKADQMRAGLDIYSLEQFSDYYKENYAKTFPNIEVKSDLKVDDDLKNNKISLHEEYILRDNWNVSKEENRSRKTFRYEPINLYGYISTVSCEEKKFPVAIPFPSKVKQKTIIHYPDSIAVNEGETIVVNKAFYFRKKMSLVKSNTLEIDYEFWTKVDEISQTSYANVCKAINQLVNDLPLKIFYNHADEAFSKKQIEKYFKKALFSTEKTIKITEIEEDSSMEAEDELTISDQGEEEASEYIIVEEMPEFPGGEDSLHSFIQSAIIYPEWEKKQKIEGTVYVKYIIDELGNPTNAEIIRSVDGSKNFDREVIRIIEMMPKWKAGKQKGKAVRVQYVLPIKFNL